MRARRHRILRVAASSNTAIQETLRDSRAASLSFHVGQHEAYRHYLPSTAL